MTPNTLTHNGGVLFQCLPSTASQSLSSPPSFKSISHFVSASFSPSLFQKCSLNHFILLFLFFLHLPSLHFCPPTPSPVLFTPQALSNQSSHYSILFILFPLFHTIHTIYTIPTSKAYQISPLLWLPHIYTSLSIQSTSWHNLIANRNLFLKRNLPFQNERTIPGRIILLIGKLLFFIWITQPPTLQRQQSNSVLKSNQSARRNIFTHPNHHILHLRALHEKHLLLRAVHMHPWVRQQIHMIPIQWLCDEGPPKSTG